MSNRTLGLIMIGAGAALVVAGIIGTVASDGEDGQAAPPETTTAPAATTAATTAPPATTNTPATTTAATTTTTTATTTTSAPTTTAAPPPPAETIDAFVDRFAAAIGDADTAFLFERLHPVVFERHDPELCRTFIQREILTLVDYRLNGDLPEPTPRTYATPAGTTRIESHYEVPVAFGFGGDTFEVTASFAVEDGMVLWFTECR